MFQATAPPSAYKGTPPPPPHPAPPKEVNSQTQVGKLTWKRRSSRAHKVNKGMDGGEVRVETGPARGGRGTRGAATDRRKDPCLPPPPPEKRHKDIPDMSHTMGMQFKQPHARHTTTTKATAVFLIPQFCPHRPRPGLLVHSNNLLMKPSKALPRSKLSYSEVIFVHKFIPSSHHSLGRLYQALSDDEIGPPWMSGQRLALCRPVSPDNYIFLHCNLRSSRSCFPACLQSSETARFLLFFPFFFLFFLLHRCIEQFTVMHATSAPRS